MRVLCVTSQWPSPQHPEYVPFLVREVEFLRKIGIDIDVFHFQGGVHPVRYLRAWWRLQQRQKQNSYDLIHVHFGQSGLITLFPKRLPLVVTFRGSDLNGVEDSRGQLTLYGLFLRKLSQIVARRADEIILVSEKMAQYVEKRSYHVIPSGGLDLDLFRHIPQQAARRALSLPVEPRYILFAARRENPIKRFELAREAVAHLNPELGAELLVAEGVPPDQMPLYINAADIVLLTSSREGSPNIVKEALACNQRVVSVDVGDVRERLAGIGGCVVCDDDQPATIAAAIETALSAPAPTNGREAVEQLSGEQLVRQIAQIYDLALRRSKNALHPQKQRGLKSEF